MRKKVAKYTCFWVSLLVSAIFAQDKSEALHEDKSSTPAAHLRSLLIAIEAAVNDGDFARARDLRLEIEVIRRNIVTTKPAAGK